ncbi:hypothetical protein CEXT_257971 [Caerostris extrusa]|uniref:Uncharacterized protein n=1 Tax=Caerostris extrusa TaxID=172846 RepID=A0AAV4NE31_CAEEX|nr:hypothetical protein CEXT_257971 [Caerostris extrusa]
MPISGLTYTCPFPAERCSLYCWSTYTSESGQIIEAKPVEQNVSETLDDNVLLETATDAEIILDSYNNDNLLDPVIVLDSTLDNLYSDTNDFVETTTEEEISVIDYYNVLSDINKDIDLKMDHDTILLDAPIDDEKILVTFMKMS